MRVQRANDNVSAVLHSDAGGHVSKGALECTFVCMWRECVARIAPKDMLNGASNLTKTMFSGG